MATLKQRRVAKILMENRGIALSKAMEMADYSPATAKNPQNLTQSKGFWEVLNDEIPDQFGIDVHKAGLEAYHEVPRIVDRDEKGNPIYAYVKVPDFHAQHKFLELLYRAKKHLSNDAETNQGDLNIFIDKYNASAQTNEHQHPIQVSGEVLPIAVPERDESGIQKSRHRLAPKKRQGQDGATSGGGENADASGNVLLHFSDLQPGP